MTFGKAVDMLKQGKKVARKGWGGYWFIPDDISIGTLVDEKTSLYASQSINKMILAKLKDGGYAPAQPYQADILADDWVAIEE